MPPKQTETLPLKIKKLQKPELPTLLKFAALADPKYLPTRKRATSVLPSDRTSGHLGRGMDFAEFRHYCPGDDVRSIDWRVTARTNRPHIRLYREEKERPVFILVDQSETMRFGTRQQFKSVLAAKVGALLAWSAFKNHDRVGGLVMGVPESTVLKPKSGKSGVLYFLNDLVEAREAAPLNLEASLKVLRPQVKSSSVICLVSDFENFTLDAQRQLQLLARYNDCLCVHVSDPLEKAAPPPGEYLVSDRGQEYLWDTELGTDTEAYAEQFQEKFSAVKDFCSGNGINFWPVETGEDLVLKFPSSGG